MGVDETEFKMILVGYSDRSLAEDLPFKDHVLVWVIRGAISYKR